jgi:hypothetical protein
MDRKSALILGASILLGCLLLSAAHLAAMLSTTTPIEAAGKRRYEVLLPLRHNDGRPVMADKIEKTLNEFETQFGGYTYAPHPLKGTWNSDGKRYEDESALVFVDVDDNPANRRWFVDLKQRLAGRFEQHDVYVTSHAIRGE